MILTIQIKCDNAAFDYRAEDEISRILEDLADKLQQQSVEDMPVIRDINGNTVGEMFIE